MAATSPLSRRAPTTADHASTPHLAALYAFHDRAGLFAGSGEAPGRVAPFASGRWVDPWRCRTLRWQEVGRPAGKGQRPVDPRGFEKRTFPPGRPALRTFPFPLLLAVAGILLGVAAGLLRVSADLLRSLVNSQFSRQQ